MLWVLIRIALVYRLAKAILMGIHNICFYGDHKNICCGYSLESNEYSQHLFYGDHKNICCGYSLESPWQGDITLARRF